MINTTNYDGVYNCKIYESEDCLIIEEIPCNDDFEMAVKMDKHGFIKCRYLHESEWFDVSVSTISTVLTMLNDNEKYTDEFLDLN